MGWTTWPFHRELGRKVENSIPWCYKVVRPWTSALEEISTPEIENGWELLFNGKDMSNWRNFKTNTVNSKWIIDNGSLHLTGPGGGDLISKKVYKNFELKLDWKISEAGNSGIFILADELGKHIYSHAVEVQILDNERHADNKIASHLSGSLYDILASPTSSHKEAGQWNSVHIKYFNENITVQQNNVVTADISISSGEWARLINKSKFKNWQGFAKSKTGHIGLQDHSDPVWFKNIKIKEIKQ